MKNLIKKILSPRNLGAVIAILIVTAATAAAAIPAYKSWLLQGTNLYTTGTNVGIGTMSPSERLEVAGNANISGVVDIGSLAGASFPLDVYSSGHATVRIQAAGPNGNNASIQLIGGGANANWSIVTNRGDLAQNVDDLIFRKEDGSPGAKMVIQNSGNVGIGTTGPGAKLDVLNGNIRVGSQLGSAGIEFYPATAGTPTNAGSIFGVGGTPNNIAIMPVGNVGIGTTNPPQKLTVVGGNIGLDSGRFLLWPNHSLLGAADLDINTINNIVFRTGSPTGGTARLLIQGTNGNVGIGTVSPGAKLQVMLGDVAVTTQGNGVILRATNGANCYRITVDNAGTLSSTLVSCP